MHQANFGRGLVETNVLSATVPSHASPRTVCRPGSANGQNGEVTASTYLSNFPITKKN
jgi:hypothetical protein